MTAGATEFVVEMERLWTQKLGNKCNDGFRAVWRMMAETYVEAIKENMRHNPLAIVPPPKWLVLAPEMGVGKTVGACVYLGMMAKAALKLPWPMKLGGLFVCRTIKQCEEAVKAINDQAGYKAAITRHSENSVTIDETKKCPILVITHAAVVNPDTAARNSLLATYRNWEHGERCLTIIDEALGNAVEFHAVTEQSLLRLLGRISPVVKERNRLAWMIVDGLLARIRHLAKHNREALGAWDKITGPSEFDRFPALFDRLLKDLATAMKSERRKGWNDQEQRKAELAESKELLRSIALMYRHWAMFTVRGVEPGIVTAQPMLPDLWCPVLLNATANQDVLLDHIGATIVPLPKVRNYRNLTIRILRTKGIGKEAMVANAGERMQRLGEFIRRDTQDGDQWLVVTHKGTEDIARLHLPEHLGVTAHWGALDGLNDFRECNKVVLFGLSFRDPTWSPALYFALRGMQQQDWFKSDRAKEIKHDLEAKALAAQVIQALGRARSRQVADEEGNCLPTTTYITLPDNKLGRSVQSYICDELPGVVIEPWGYQLDGANGTELQQAPSLAAAVVTHMANRPPGKYTVSEIALELGLDRGRTAALKDGLKKRRKIVDDLARLGVNYVVEGERKGAKSYLIKS